MANSVTPDDVDVFLANAAWAIRSTYHTVLKASPGAAIFGQDMLFEILFMADWHKIGEWRWSLTHRGNQQQNAKWIDYDYKVGDKVLLSNKGILRKAASAYCKCHGLSLQFIRMELSQFNMEPKQNDLVSRE